MRYPGKWEKDKWRVTQPGNYQWHYAEHADTGMMLWLTDAGGRGDNWAVMAGTSTRGRDRRHLASGLPNKQIAEGIIQEAMKDHSSPTSPYDMKKYGRRGEFGGF